MEALVKSILAEMAAFQENATKQLAGNQAAGARARKNALNLMKSCKEFRALSNKAGKE